MSKSSEIVDFQFELDLTYSKYLQNIVLKQYLTKLHDQLDESIDEQLTIYDELYENKIVEQNKHLQSLNDLKRMQEAVPRIKLAQNSMEKYSAIIDEQKIDDKINTLRYQLRSLCDRFYLENAQFVETKENYEQLQHVLEEISNTLGEMYGKEDEESGSNSTGFLLLVENITKINELLNDLRKNHEKVSNCESDISKLTLKVVSLELTQEIEDENESKSLP